MIAQQELNGIYYSLSLSLLRRLVLKIPILKETPPPKKSFKKIKFWKLPL